MGTPHRPKHPGLFEPLRDYGPATSFDDARADEEALSSELRILHKFFVFKEVRELFERLFARYSAFGYQRSNRVSELADCALIEQVFPFLFLVGCPASDGQRVEMFTGVVEVDDVGRLGEVGLNDGLIVSRAVGEDDHRARLIQAAVYRLLIDAFTKEGAGFETRHKGCRVIVADGKALVGGVGLGEHTADLDFSPLGRAVRLPAFSSRHFLSSTPLKWKVITPWDTGRVFLNFAVLGVPRLC